jgi:hypothetical protein
VADRRGWCDTCGYRFRLRRDGTVPGHRLYHGDVRDEEECPGSGKPARPLRFDPAGHPECGECLMYLSSHGAGLAEAVSSVSIETGGSPQQLLQDYLGAYHGRDHKEVSRA